MKLTARSEYALLALVYLGRQKSAELVSAETIARAQGIPPKFLEQILLTLKRARYLRSTKGQRGGYQLAKPVDAVTLAEIVRLFDGALAPTESTSRYFYKPSPIERERRLLRVFREVRDLVSNRLEAATIADML
ncbi:MAG: Rrf2 family transcriptional regulator [Steroidobacteraceae bacterium]|jgi:Rrf2 family protein